MTKQAVLYLILLLAGLAGGTGLGYLITQSKLDEAQAAVDKLNTQIEDLTARSETELKTATARLSRLEADLTKARNEIMRKNTELQKAEANVERMKTLLQQTMQGNRPAGEVGITPSATAPEPGRRISPAPASAAAVPSAAAGSVREYTIKDGDSLWKIAATELGSGTRWEDILKLNPGMTKDTTLTVGSKIKIPAR